MAKVKLPSVAEVIMGQSPPGESYNEVGKGLPFYQGKTEFGDLSPTPRKWCTDAKRVAEAGDVLISVRAPVGPTNSAIERCCIGRGLAAIRADQSRLDLGYLRFFLRFAEPKLASMGQGSTFAAIGRAEIASLELELLSLDEQRRIVDFLSRAEGIVRLRREARRKAAELIPTIFMDMFGDPATNPKGWTVKPLVEVASFMSGGTPPKVREDLWSGTLPWVSPKDMKVDCIVDAIDHVSDSVLTETNLKLVPIGSILIVVRGMILVHTVPIAITSTPVTINQDMKALMPTISIDPSFLLWALKVQHPKLLALVDTAAHGTKKLDTAKIQAIGIPIPSLQIQRQFVERADSVASIIAQQNHASDKAKASFDALLSKAFAVS